MPASSERRLPSPPSETPLLVWLLEALRPSNRTRVKQLLQHGQISVNGTPVTRHDRMVGLTDILSIGGQQTEREPAVSLPILFEDESLIAVDKPCGLLSVASETEKLDTAFTRLSSILKSRNAGRPYVVHRLDRDTSGLLLFARTPETRDQLQRNWEAVEKHYRAVVEGVPKPADGTIENHLIEGKNLRVRAARPGDGTKLAITHYRLLSTRGEYSLLEVTLGTGRKHQIRVHLAGIGCPVIGDATYGSKRNPARRLGLHAWKLVLDHPTTGKRLEVESPFPESLKRLVCG